jgi:hypothetical protein
MITLWSVEVEVMACETNYERKKKLRKHIQKHQNYELARRKEGLRKRRLTLVIRESPESSEKNIASSSL